MCSALESPATERLPCRTRLPPARAATVTCCNRDGSRRRTPRTPSAITAEGRNCSVKDHLPNMGFTLLPEFGHRWRGASGRVRRFVSLPAARQDRRRCPRRPRPGRRCSPRNLVFSADGKYVFCKSASSLSGGRQQSEVRTIHPPAGQHCIHAGRLGCLYRAMKPARPKHQKGRKVTVGI